jgi:hypothetical protein
LIKFGQTVDQKMKLQYWHGDQKLSNLVKQLINKMELLYLHGDQKWSKFVKKLINKMELPYLQEGLNLIKFGQQHDQQNGVTIPAGRFKLDQIWSKS